MSLLSLSEAISDTFTTSGHTWLFHYNTEGTMHSRTENSYPCRYWLVPLIPIAVVLSLPLFFMMSGSPALAQGGMGEGGEFVPLGDHPPTPIDNLGRAESENYRTGSVSQQLSYWKLRADLLEKEFSECRSKLLSVTTPVLQSSPPTLTSTNRAQCIADSPERSIVEYIDGAHATHYGFICGYKSTEVVQLERLGTQGRSIFVQLEAGGQPPRGMPTGVLELIPLINTLQVYHTNTKQWRAHLAVAILAN